MPWRPRRFITVENRMNVFVTCLLLSEHIPFKRLKRDIKEKLQLLCSRVVTHLNSFDTIGKQSSTLCSCEVCAQRQWNKCFECCEWMCSMCSAWRYVRNTQVSFLFKWRVQISTGHVNVSADCSIDQEAAGLRWQTWGSNHRLNPSMPEWLDPTLRGSNHRLNP